jgi:hypothetical protein
MAQKKKGIATETIFYIVIGIAVVSLVVLLVVNYTGKTRSEGNCRTAQDKYCEAWSAENYANSAGPQAAGFNWDTNFKPTYNLGATCLKPSSTICSSRGYNQSV